MYIDRSLTLSYAGAIIGQIIVGVICDRLGRKVALVGTTLFIVIGAILGTAAYGAHGSVQGLFWFLTFARGITGIVRIQIRLSKLPLSSSFCFIGCRRRIPCLFYQC